MVQKVLVITLVMRDRSFRGGLRRNLFVLAACLVLFPASAEERATNGTTKPTLVAKEQLTGAWHGYDAANAVGFSVTFTNTLHLSNQIEIATLTLKRWDRQDHMLSEVTQESPDAPFKFGNWAEFVPLPNDRLRVRMNRGFVLPWVPTEAILERVKTNGAK